MTLKDFLKRINGLDLDRMMIWSDGCKGWTNVEIRIDEDNIYICPDKQCSSFSSDRE